MTPYEFPLRSANELIERLDQPPANVHVHRWVLRDDNQQNYHGRLELTEDPAVVELRWKSDARGREQTVGVYRLHLAALLAERYVRLENDLTDNTEVRLRFYRADRGVVVIQTSQGEPALPIGMIDRSLG